MSVAWDPPADPSLEPFWEGARDGALRVPACLDCDRVVLRPRVICPYCHGESLEWRTLSGRGTVYAFGVEHRPVGMAVGLEAPYVVALVDLEEGGRLVTNIIGDPDDVLVGMAVEGGFEALPDGRRVPRVRRT